jgi:hypothetical protein
MTYCAKANRGEYDGGFISAQRKLGSEVKHPAAVNADGGARDGQCESADMVPGSGEQIRTLWRGVEG